MRKAHKDKLSSQEANEVKAFYLSGEESRCLPNKRDVSKKTNRERFILTMPIRDAYLAYRKKNPARKIGFTSFYKLKPKNLKKVSETNRRCCLCQVCCNVALKAETANKLLSGKENYKYLTKRDAADLTVCPYEGEFPDSSCINGTCDQCGKQGLINYFNPYMEELKNTEVQYHRWESISIKGKDDKVKKCVSCVSKTAIFEEFVEDFVKDTLPLASHLFRATWQIQQLEKCKETLTEEKALVVMDFAENYSCRYQNEVQSAFWDTNQVTIHPMMTYYFTETEDDTNDSKVLRKHAIIGISDDRKHDADSAEMFRSHLRHILKKENPKINKIYEWTDG